MAKKRSSNIFSPTVATGWRSLGSGFRFDRVTSMIYYDHGLERNFTKYEEYFDGQQDEDALTYLFLANKMIRINPEALTIAKR